MALTESSSYSQPIYFRMPRDGSPKIYTKENCRFKIGKANVLLEGHDITIIAIGRCVHYALQATKRLSEEDNLSIKVIDMCTIKPLDKSMIESSVIETGRIVFVEDHNVYGGLGIMVSDSITNMGLKCKLVKLGIPDEFSVIGRSEDIAGHYGFDENGIVNAIHSNFWVYCFEFINLE